MVRTPDEHWLIKRHEVRGKLVICPKDVAACFIEKVHGSPKQKAGSAFAFGEDFGWWCGTLSALGYEPVLVTPQGWMGEVVTEELPKGSTNKDYAARKEALYKFAKTLGYRGPKYGADAFLITHYHDPISGMH